MTSALAENFLRKIRKQNYIKYIDGTDIVETKEDLVNIHTHIYVYLRVEEQRFTYGFSIILHIYIYVYIIA